MAFHIFVVDRTVFFQPLLHGSTIYVVIVEPSFITSIVGRVNEDAFDTVGVAREQRFESVEIIALNDEVILIARRVARSAFVPFKLAVGDRKMVCVDMVFSL